MLSLFCGWGGGDRGLHDAGFFTPWAVDFERHARECYKLNFPTTRIESWDLFKTRIEFIMQEFSIKQRQVDLLLLACPCQGVSGAGKGDPYDERNILFLRSLRHYIPAILPKTWVLENVEGLTEANMAPFYNLMQEELKTLEKDYIIVQRVLNTLDYGVPQSRNRFIIIAVHRSLGVEPSYPEPVYSELGLRICDVLPYLDGIHYAYHKKKFKFRTEYCNTITKTPNIWAKESGKIREFRIDELLKLCAYPSDWKYTGSHGQVWNRIGNSIMPPFMRAIGEHIRVNILEKAGVPKQDINPYVDFNLAYNLKQAEVPQKKNRRAANTNLQN